MVVKGHYVVLIQLMGDTRNSIPRGMLLIWLSGRGALETEATDVSIEFLLIVVLGSRVGVCRELQSGN